MFDTKARISVYMHVDVRSIPGGVSAVYDFPLQCLLLGTEVCLCFAVSRSSCPVKDHSEYPEIIQRLVFKHMHMGLVQSGAFSF